MKKIAIIGAGESGFGAALLAHAKAHEVFVSDAGNISDERKAVLSQKGIHYEEQGHSLEKLLQAEEVIKSPGIAYSHPAIQEIVKAGIPVIDELEFASRYTRGRIIAITGTNGKTTTSLLTYHLMKSTDLDVGLAGNVGQSWAGQLVSEDHDWWVLEVSSFQIEGFRAFKPKIAVLLNITPDHLDRYQQNLDEYIATKMRLTDNMDEKGHFIYFGEDDYLKSGLEKMKGVPKKYAIHSDQKESSGFYFDDKAVHLDADGERWSWNAEEMALKGRHNMINSLCAILAVKLAGGKKDGIGKGLRSFKNAPHRLEFSGEIHGISFINDSKGTNVDATAYALATFSQPIIWIAGGIDKGNDYTVLFPIVKGRVKALVCLGKDNKKLKAAFEGLVPEIIETEKMAEAVGQSLKLGKPGDVVLLSPACASFDLFKNYEDRGNQFKAAVEELKESSKW
ncbi:UDP-N-acetylmuramoyl-L-alanine--D-glutamate ligase [Negadavirga shengliensis]|uniref:UDP-N-acetylmuramoylalanine--D-glutamate ligase n=1 Tax=Negadavirga shengliensis TaxID=1389218 RepID=A0ABV9T293_9BACT